jgi:hypothetical protein
MGWRCIRRHRAVSTLVQTERWLHVLTTTASHCMVGQRVDMFLLWLCACCCSNTWHFLYLGHPVSDCCLPCIAQWQCCSGLTCKVEEVGNQVIYAAEAIVQCTELVAGLWV